MITRLPVALLVVVVAVTNGQLTQDQLNKFTAGGVTIKDDGDYWEFEHDGIPDHDIGQFPGKGNPNEVSEQEHKFKIPKTPKKAAERQCLTMGPIAVAPNGVPYFNPFTAEGTNAVEHETFDSCLGHPQQRGAYHYHQFSHCVPGANEVDAFVGVAFDGFPIYSPLTMGSNGRHKNFTSADLDQCHGLDGPNGYEYRMTYDFPYILGCYTGMPTEMERPGDGMGPRPNDGRTPPPGVSRPPRPPGGQPSFDFCVADRDCPNPIECGAGTMAVSLLVLLIGLMLSM